MSAPVTVALRIPGTWTGAGELRDRLPPGYQLEPGTLVLPDGAEIEFGAMAPDAQFADIFRTSCRQAPTREEQAAVQGYRVNATLCGPGGSLASARITMQAAAAIIRAGGAGVFIDNNGLAHGGRNWLAMADDGSSDALSFAFVAIIRGTTEVWTLGMHVLDLRDLVMKRSDVEAGGFDIVELIRYLARGAKPVDDGHVIIDREGPRFRASFAETPAQLAASPMHNPFGRLRLVSWRDLAEKN